MWFLKNITYNKTMHLELFQRFKNSRLQHSSGWILFSNKFISKNIRILNLTKDIYQNNQKACLNLNTENIEKF